MVTGLRGFTFVGNLIIQGVFEGWLEFIEELFVRSFLSLKLIYILVLHSLGLYCGIVCLSGRSDYSIKVSILSDLELVLIGRENETSSNKKIRYH